MPGAGLSHVRHFNVYSVFAGRGLFWSTDPLCGLGLDLGAK